MEKPNLRVGIISDVHIGFTGHLDPHYCGGTQPGSQDLWWEYTLRWYAARGVDVIAVPGDMTNACDYSVPKWSAEYSYDEMRRFNDIFRKVFDGTDTELVTIYGNHDQFVQKWETMNGGDKNPWQEIFGEPYEHVFCKKVHGISFIGAHWGYEGEAKALIRQEATANPEQPVFYLQHGAIKNTIPGSDPNRFGEVFDEGLENVRDFSNVIALTGHTHCPITDERSIWQSKDPQKAKCTSIACSTLNYGCPDGGFVRGENLWTKHGLYLTVTGEKIHVERLSFWTEHMLELAEEKCHIQNLSLSSVSAGDDWDFTLNGEKVYDAAERAQRSIAPEFEEGSFAGAWRGDTFIQVSCPAAIPPSDGSPIHSYYVEALDETGKIVRTAEVSTEHHIDRRPIWYHAPYTMFVYGLQPDTEYRFRVYARNCWQKMSEKPLCFRARTLKDCPSRMK